MILKIKLWEKDLVVCELRLHDMNTICHIKDILEYKEEDQKKIRKVIADLLEKRLIRPLTSSHHAPTFYVRNHVEKVREKARMGSKEANLFLYHLLARFRRCLST